MTEEEYDRIVTEELHVDRVIALEAEVKRLRQLAVHCPDCGGDYAETGLEVGCKCKLEADLAALRQRHAEVAAELTQLREAATMRLTAALDGDQ